MYAPTWHGVFSGSRPCCLDGSGLPTLCFIGGVGRYITNEYTVMYLNVLALDFDGTLAEQGHIEGETWSVLEQARAAGFTLMLVTGRTLQTFMSNRPYTEAFEAIVAEDGAAVYYPKSDSVVLPFGRLRPELVQRLEQTHMPLELGTAIAATWTPHDQEVLATLRALGGGATVEYNRGAVMVLPPGATKGTGLQAVLHELGYSAHNVCACGDAENDQSLFEVSELAVAVANATAGAKSQADVVLSHPNGQGVQTLVRGLLAGTVPPHEPRASRRIQIGREAAGRAPVFVSPLSLLSGNVGVVGGSGSGKSWSVGFLAEQLLQRGYQLCIIDPEGDYRGLRAYPRTLLLGGVDVMLPPPEDVLMLAEYTDVSFILDLSTYTLPDRQAYVAQLLPALSALRARRGRPHWFVIDEIHSFCPAEGSPTTQAVLDHAPGGGFAFVSYSPQQVNPAILDAVDHWLITRMQMPDEMALVGRMLNGAGFTGYDPGMPAGLAVGQALLYMEDTAGEPLPSPGLIEFESTRRVVPHVRHLHKYLHAQLPEPKRFYFHLNGADGEGDQCPQSAASLWAFREALPHVPLSTLEYHTERGDFERWMDEVLHDPELARRMRKLARRPLEGEALREAIIRAVANRYRELEALI